MKPDPSRTWRKWILPLDRRLASQPLIVTDWPSYFAMSSMYACMDIGTIGMASAGPGRQTQPIPIRAELERLRQVI